MITYGVLNMKDDNLVRKAVVECFRDFIDRHGYELKHVGHGGFMDESQIMCMFGEMQGQYRTAAKKTLEEEKRKYCHYCYNEGWISDPAGRAGRAKRCQHCNTKQGR